MTLGRRRIRFRRRAAHVGDLLKQLRRARGVLASILRSPVSSTSSTPPTRSRSLCCAASRP